MTGDFNKALEASKEIRERYPKYIIQDNAALVLEYYQAIIDLSDNGGLTRKQACFLIADTMWYNCVRSNHELESVAIDAGHQELPDRHVTGDPNDRWELLKIWVADMHLRYQ
jgi:hypothetical protein